MITRIWNHNTYHTKIRLPSFFCARYLIKWQPNHCTKLHGHDDSKCTFYLLYGEVKESKYTLKDKYYNTDNNKLDKFLDKGYIDNTMGKHVMHNISNKPSYTYHIYKK